MKNKYIPYVLVSDDYMVTVYPRRVVWDAVRDLSLGEDVL